MALDDLEQARFRIYALEDGAVRAQALAFCLHSGFFETLAAEPLAAAEIGRRQGLAPRVLPALLGFLVSEHLLEKDDREKFELTQAARTFLLRSSPRYIGGRGVLFQRFYRAIEHLPEALATGRPWTPSGQHDMFGGFADSDQQWFAEGMFANAIHGAAGLLAQVDFTSFTRLLDVGGNAGGYAIAILRAHPHLRATIFDLESLRQLALERIPEAGMAGRIGFAAGSFFDEPLPAGHDALLLANILHDWDDGDCERIVARCFAALEPGGIVVVTEPMLADDFSGPDHPSVSGLTMALLGGENRTRTRIASMLGAAGFRETWTSPLGHQNSIVTARKPAVPGER